VVLGHPESLFGVRSVTGTSSDTVGMMKTGDWMRGRDGELAYGSLGVFIDTAVGSPAVAHRPPGAWAVTTDLSITFYGVSDLAGPELRAVSRTVSTDNRSAVVDDEIFGAHGELIAKATERIPCSPGQAISRYAVTPSAERDGTDVMTLLGARTRYEGMWLDVGSSCLNPEGALHDGSDGVLVRTRRRRCGGAHVEGLAPAAIQMSHIRPRRNRV